MDCAGVARVEEPVVNGVVLGPEEEVALDRRLEEALPLPKVDRLLILLNQWRKILSAKNLHIPGGYAAVGAVWKPPLALRPTIFSR